MSTGNGSIAASQYAKAINSTSANHAHYSKKWAGTKASLIKVKKEKKKMGWFKKKFANWCREAWENSRRDDSYAVESVRPHEGVNGKTSVRFTIYAASGGHIIEYYKQDRYKDGDGPELVIVNQGDELGKAVEHILTMEALKS